MRAHALLAAATERYTIGFFPEGSNDTELQRLVSTTLPDAKAKNRPFFVVYEMKMPRAPAEVCSSVIADPPLVEGEGIANIFSRSGTATFMAARGPDFRTGLTTRAPTSNADLSRTIASLLDLDVDSYNARVLREVLSGPRNRAAPIAKPDIVSSTPAVDGLVTELHMQTVGSVVYLDSAVASHLEALATETDRPRRQWHWPFKTFSITISDDKF